MGRGQIIDNRISPCIAYPVKVFIFIHDRHKVVLHIPAVTQDDDIFFAENSSIIWRTRPEASSSFDSFFYIRYPTKTAR